MICVRQGLPLEQAIGFIFRRKKTMPKRSHDWNEGLAEDLKNPEFAREFVMAALEEGVSLQVALGKVIRAYGVKEYASKVCMASSNVQRAIHPNHNPTQETLNRLLSPLELKLAVVPIHKGESAA
jgi:DNA-binding phage protein